jgi:hypothetical protein
MANTANRNYPLPVPSNPVRDDVARLIAAFEAVDGDVAGLLAALATKAAINHGHSLADIAGLVDALNGKAAVGHTHSLAGLSDVSIAGAPVGRPLTTQAGGTVGIGPDWSAEIAGKVSAENVQSHRNDVSWGADLVRVDGAHAAMLANHVNYYGATAGRNIDEVEAGDVGLYSTSNPGTWPPSAVTFWFVTTQRLYTGQAVLQRAVSYASGAPSTGDGFEFIRLRGNGGVWSSWRRVLHTNDAGAVDMPETYWKDAQQHISGTAGNYPSINYTRIGDPGRSFAQGWDPANRVLFWNKWNPATGAYEGQLLEIHHDGSVVVGATTYPSGDNAYDLGTGTNRWREIHGRVVNAEELRLNGEPLALLLSAEYESAPTSVAAGTTYTFAHGLGVKPKFVIFTAYCINSSGAYAYSASVGDEARCDNAESTALMWRADETNIYVPFGAAGSGLELTFQMNTGAGVGLVLPSAALAGNWQLKVRAYG